MTTRSSFRRLLAASLAALVAAGCAQSNGDITRVQPNVLRKADILDGEWYFRNTVTWTPFNTNFTFPGQTGVMEKLVWEVQQNMLVGYRSYPFMPGAEQTIDQTSTVSGTTARYCDAEGKCAGGQRYYGAPVVAFTITSHFDIMRGYNNATGEPTNVISENATDRVWNEREYIRVNWAVNLVDRWQGLSYGIIGNPNNPFAISNANWIQPNEPDSDPYDWPTFEYTDRNGDNEKELTYFDVTGRYIANPATINYFGYTIPVCWLMGAAQQYDCASAEVRMRMSVAKVDPAWSQDYEPLVYGHDLMSYFGFFRTERLSWDQKFGNTETGRILLADRHRNWKQYYKRDAAGKLTNEPIPLEDREPLPIKYYFTPAHKMGGQARYDEFWEPGRIIERDFNRAFKRATTAAKGRTAAEKENWEPTQQMFYVCNNPVKAGDPAECGKANFSPKVGDLRYSFINTVAEPVANGLLGYGPSSPDPETGQLISGMSNTYTWGVDLYGRSINNWIQLLNGDMDLTDYISGQVVRDYVKSHKTYNIKKVQGAVQAALQGAPQRPDLSTGVFDRPAPRMTQLLARLNADKTVIGHDASGMAEKMANFFVEYPEVESLMIDAPEVREQLLSLVPPFARHIAENDPEVFRKAVREALTDPRSMASWETNRVAELSKASITTFDFYDRSLVSFAELMANEREERIALYENQGFPEAEAKVKADDDISKIIRQKVWLATSLHEAGHTLNLRHNFQGSYDSINYFDVFWELRKSSFTVDDMGVKKLPRTAADLKNVADNVGPVLQLALAEGLHDGEYSSIMDYSGRQWTDWQGLGKYDEAAIMFAYSGDSQPGWVEVFDSARRGTIQVPGSDGNMVEITGAGVDLPFVNVTHTTPTIPNYTERFHYSLVPLHFGDGQSGNNVEAIIESGIEKLKQRSLVRWSEVVADEARVRQILQDDPTLIDDPARADTVLGDTLLRVPYMFCSDESADGPVLSCNRFDMGPDYYQIVRANLEQYWNYYFDSHFRKDRPYFTSTRAIYGAYNTFSFAANSYKHWVFEQYKQATSVQEQVVRYKFDPTFQDYWTMAVLDGVNQHLNVMAVPQAGFYYLRTTTRTGEPRWDYISGGEDYEYETPAGIGFLADYTQRYLGGTDWTIVPRGLGRMLGNRFDHKGGYNFHNRINEIGHFADHLGAMIAAVDPSFQVQGVDVIADLQRYTIPYSLVFRDEFFQTFSALWADHEEWLRPTMYKQPLETWPNGPNGGISNNPAIDWRTHVRGQDFYANLEYPRERTACNTGAGDNPLYDYCFLPEMNPAPVTVSISWISQIYALSLGMQVFSVNYDLDYAKTNQIYKYGSGESFQVANGYRAVTLDDFRTGHVYAAVEVDAPDTPPNSTGAVRMISIGNDYKLMVENPGRCPIPDYLYYQIGYSCMPAADANNPAKIEDRRRMWENAFRNHISLMDIQRLYYAYLGKAW